MTADTALSASALAPAGEASVVGELQGQFGADALTLQDTRTGMPVIWVARERIIEVLRFLRNLPRPYVMLYDLHGVDERLRHVAAELALADVELLGA